MSSQPERKEKICLNCNTELVGRFCHVCGQENVVTKQDFWSLTKHFIYDIFHFDGKFFETLKYLLIAPGRVPREFVAGKRVTFLQPIRMYLFTSALFFLVFFSMNSIFATEEEPVDRDDRRELILTFKKLAREYPGDSIVLLSKVKLLEDTTRALMPSTLFKGMGFPLNGKLYHSVREYDSIQRTLPDTAQDKSVRKIMVRKLISLHAQKGMDPNSALNAFFDEFLHNFPYMLFVSLPFFAGILKLLYVRRRHLFYSDHAVFTIYHYIISFILLLCVIFLKKFDEWVHWKFIRYIGMALAVWWLLYLLISMKRFYQQSWGKTTLKFFLLSFLAMILMILLFLCLIFFTAYQL